MPEKKKPPRFTLKKLVQRLHIREPAQHVYSLLGYRWEDTPWPSIPFGQLRDFSTSMAPVPVVVSLATLVWADIACRHYWLALTGSPFLSWVIFSWLWDDKLFLLCSRYPSNLQAFSQSRLPGPWDSSRAGKRMKLSQPETWERELSLWGNKASVWEELIGTVTLTITPSSVLPCLCLSILD